MEPTDEIYTLSLEVIGEKNFKNAHVVSEPE